MDKNPIRLTIAFAALPAAGAQCVKQSPPNYGPGTDQVVPAALSVCSPS